MPDIEEESLRCIGLLYDAVLDKKEWPGILEAIATALLGNSAMLRHINPQTREIAFYETIGYETHFVRAYHEYFSLLDPYQAILQKAPVGQLLNPDHDLGHGRRRASEYFNDFDLPQDKIHVIGGVLHRDATGDIQFGIQRGKSAGEYDSRDQHLLQRLIPHIVRAVRMQQVLAAAEYQQTMAYASLDYLKIGVLLHDANSEIAYHNQMAENLFKHGLLTLKNKRMASCNSKDNVQLQAMLMAAIHKHEGADMCCCVKTPQLQESLQIWVSPLPKAPMKESGGAVVFISRPGAAQLPWQQVAKYYGLTPAEAKLAVALVDGKTLEEVALSSGISYETARAQLRSVFAKTGVRRQQQLMLLSLQGVLASCQELSPR